LSPSRRLCRLPSFRQLEEVPSLATPGLPRIELDRSEATFQYSLEKGVVVR